jgi:hypothetical protein
VFQRTIPFSMGRGRGGIANKSGLFENPAQLANNTPARRMIAPEIFHPIGNVLAAG